jgi:DNA-binding IclR family transcriptional regulator
MIRSVERVLDILLLFSNKKPRWSLTEISRQTEIPKTTVFNLVKTLEVKGFIRQDKETLKYTLGHKLFTLGSTMIETFEINQKAIVPSHYLAESTGLNCKVGIWDDDAVIVTVDIGLAHTGFLSKRLGPRLIAYCSALGRSILAYISSDRLHSYLDQTELVSLTPNTIVDREQLLHQLQLTKHLGYSINKEEINLGASSIGAPVFAGDQEVVASICLDGPTDVILGEKMNTYIEALKSAAAEISLSMGWRRVLPGEVD